MKTGMMTLLLFMLSGVLSAREAVVTVFKHELRWTDESRFPNYFILPDLRDSIFSDTRQELMKVLDVSDVKLPETVGYRIIAGFGNQKTEMPLVPVTSGPEIGIFSFITRATSGYAMFWKMTVTVRENGTTLLSKTVSHELEYYDASGYFSSRRWLSPEEFREIFGMLVKEALGSLTASEEKIVLADPEEKEVMVRSLFPGSERALLKINGGWRNAGNFAALLETENDTLASVDYKAGWTSESAGISGSSVFAALFTEITGIDMGYSQKVKVEKKGTLHFSDGQKTKLNLQWIEIQERSVKSEEGISQITEPMITRLWDDEVQAGDFLYTRHEKVHAARETKQSINLMTGMLTQNSLGLERTHRIEGFMYNTPVFAEYNEFHGIIEVSLDTTLLAMAVMQNTNPGNRSFGNSRLAKNKKAATSAMSNTGKKSLNKADKAEWYPVYLPADATEEDGKMVIRILSCLFFGIGNRGGPVITEE